ncbi:MAG: hypothetical protein AAF909_14270 [Pseudomonadota bacterium]
MRHFVIAAIAAAGLLATPAMARVVTVEFSVEGGESEVWVFDEKAAMVTAPDGEAYPYTFDEEARKVCATTAEGDLCATFTGGTGEIKVGEVSDYTATNGNSGQSTITAIVE